MNTDGPKDRKKMNDEEKKRDRLERNRVAAVKSRQPKKQWLGNLHAKIELLRVPVHGQNVPVPNLSAPTTKEMGGGMGMGGMIPAMMQEMQLDHHD